MRIIKDDLTGELFGVVDSYPSAEGADTNLSLPLEVYGITTSTNTINARRWQPRIFVKDNLFNGEEGPPIPAVQPPGHEEKACATTAAEKSSPLKEAEDKILAILKDLSEPQKCLLYATLYHQGMRIDHCETVVKRNFKV